MKTLPDGLHPQVTEGNSGNPPLSWIKKCQSVMVSSGCFVK